jgi:hypothetical protein
LRQIVKRFPGLKTLAILCISLLAGACAVDRPPTGGPPDTAPLAVTSSSPEPGSVNTTPSVITIRFSRFVTTSEVRKALIFSPAISNYEVTTHGREASIRIISPLQEGRTYTITLRKSMKSFYGNELASSWSLPFSTGPVIDHGLLAGTVWTRRLAPAPNITVMAYAIATPEAALPDSLPSAPDYATQTGASGEFRFESLAPGSYRLIAVDDRNANLRFDPSKEEYAVTSTPTVKTGDQAISFRLVSSDMTGIAIRSASALNTSEVEITFNRTIPTRALSPGAVTIRDKSDGSPLEVLGLYSVKRAEEETTFRLQTATMNPKSSYTIAYQGTVGSNDADLPEFTGGTGDLARPMLKVGFAPPNNSTNVLPETIRPEVGPCVELQTNLPVTEASVGAAIGMASVKNRTEQPLAVNVSRYDNRTWTIRPVGGFEPGLDYKISVNPGQVTTLAGAKGRDTLLVSRFSLAGPDQYGEISGTGIAATRTAIVEIRRSGTTSAFRTVVHPSAGGAFSYSFQNLPPGNYTIFAFAPSSGMFAGTEAEWSGGAFSPFRPADPFVALPVTVRQAWTTEAPAIRVPTRQGRPDPSRPAKPKNRKPPKRK